MPHVFPDVVGALVAQGAGLNSQCAYSGAILPTVDASGGFAVRRLTPLECERLQGFPDNYTLIPGRFYDRYAPRYKALGNSMAVNVMSWIGQRIAAIEAMPRV